MTTTAQTTQTTQTTQATRTTRGSRPRRASTRERVVVGVDGSTCARAALQWAGREAAMRGAELNVVHVWQDPISIGATGLPAYADDPAKARAQARRTLEQAVITGLAEATPLPTKVSSFLVEGSPAAALLDLAKDADLLVVGRSGRGAISRLLMGSVCRHCLHHARIPVVIVPEATPPSEEARHEERRQEA